MAVRIIFEPHSTTTDNEAELASGWNDVDLSELGVKQGVELLERCRDRGLDAVFCSDLQRAVKSAIPTSNELHIPIYADWRLRECNYGDFTQKPKDEVDVEKLQRIHEPFPNGESYHQCMDRMKEFLDWLRANFDGKTVMIIGHRATHYGLDHWIGGLPIEKCVAQKFTWQPGWEYQLV